MEDPYYHDITTEDTQSTLELITNILAYGLTSINYYIKKYDPIKFPFAEAADSISGDGGGGDSDGGGSTWT